MSRAQRRRGRRRPRARRAQARPRSARARRISWVTVAIPLIVVASVGLLAYMVWQRGGEEDSGGGAAAALAAEADASSDLPGEFVNLPEIYGGPYEEDAGHVQENVDYEEDQGLPPAGGPHWGAADECPTDPADAPRFCAPVPHGFYTEPWDPESLVHNLEHGDVVVWFNTDDETAIAGLRAFAEDNRDRRLVIARFPEMDEETVGISAWSRRLTFPAASFDRDALQEFLDTHQCRFDPEGSCE